MQTFITTISGTTLDRVQMTGLLAKSGSALVFDGCQLDGADFSRLDFQDAQFNNCSMLETSLYAANLSRSKWRRCRGGSTAPTCAAPKLPASGWATRPRSRERSFRTARLPR